ncbi:MAG: hypothetical protein HYW27_00595 [Candidatus Aenigmarchaeota archaeon]|nr:hypothetical protein [Candidatus Aenigmarchaeota archaeon]
MKGITKMQIAIVAALLMALVVLVILIAITGNQLFVSKREAEIERGNPYGGAGCAIQHDDASDIECVKEST